MKNLLYIFLALGMILLWGCADEEKIVNEEELISNVCANDFAEYYYNGTLFKTMHLTDQGDILTPDGENCGIGAVIDTNQDILTLRIFGEQQNLKIHAVVTNLNEELEFRFLEYTNNNITSSFNNLTLNSQNFILIEELDTVANTMKGTFNFEIENSIGETITVTNGLFNCSFSSF